MIKSMTDIAYLNSTSFVLLVKTSSGNNPDVTFDRSRYFNHTRYENVSTVQAVSPMKVILKVGSFHFLIIKSFLPNGLFAKLSLIRPFLSLNKFPKTCNPLFDRSR